MAHRHHRLTLALSFGLTLAACGGGGGSGGGGDPMPAPLADLAVSVTAAQSAPPGTLLTWTISVTNIGALAAADVRPQFTMPQGVGAMDASDSATSAAGIVSWPPTGNLAPGASLSLTVSGTAPAVGPLVGIATASTTSTESSTTNNTASARSVLGFTALHTLTGENPGSFYGFVADVLRDIDADGRPDFVTSAPGTGANGRVYVYSGASAALRFTFDGPAAGSQWGTAVADAGDVDGDGVTDILVGGPGGTGFARVYSGASGAVIHALTGPASGSQFGAAASGIGDIDGDGRADFLIGAPVASSTGSAFVYSGATATLIRRHTGQSGTNFGFGVGGLGDVDGDGRPDYAVGGGQGNGGGVDVFSGATGTRLYSVAPDATGALLGQYWIDAVGDVDRDGRPDFYAADYPNAARGAGTGRGYLISGASGSVLRTFSGEAAGDIFGISRNSGHDVDGDGVGDLFIAGYHNDEGGTDAGKAYVYSGATGALLRTMTSTQAGQTLGYDAVQLGDVDGDGLVDYLLTGDQENGQNGTLYVVRGTPLP